jgi:hypothetical protein
MDPLVLAALISAIGSMVPKSGTQDLTADFASRNGRDLNAARSNDFYAKLTQPGGNLNSNTWYNLAQQATGQAANYQNKAGAVASRGGGDILAELLKLQPAMQESAGRTAIAATSKAGTSLMDMALAASTSARNALETRFGNRGGFDMPTGGMLSALSRGAQEPILQAQQAIAQLYSQAFQNAYNPLAALASGREYGRPNEFVQVAQGFQGQAGQAGTLGAQLAQLLGQNSEQALIAPQFQGQPDMGSKMQDLGLGMAANALGQGDIEKIIQALKQLKYVPAGSGPSATSFGGNDIWRALGK